MKPKVGSKSSGVIKLTKNGVIQKTIKSKVVIELDKYAFLKNICRRL